MNEVKVCFFFTDAGLVPCSCHIVGAHVVPDDAGELVFHSALAQKDAVNSALLDMMCEMSQCGRCEYLVGCESHEPSTDACAAHLLSEAERRVEGNKV